MDLKIGIDGILGHKIGKPINAPPFFRNFMIHMPARNGILYYLFVDKKTKSFLAELNRTDMVFVDLGEIHSRWHSVFSLQVRVPQLIKKFNIDVFCSIATNDLPLWGKCKKVIRISSLVHWHRNGSLFNVRSLVYRKLLTRMFIDRADLVIANSVSMENDIRKNFNLPAGKLKMIPEAIDPAYLIPADAKKAFCDIEKLGVGRPYIMFASTFSKQKNPEILLKAFVHLRTKHKIPHKLVFVGSGSLEKPMREYAKASGVSSDVIFTGYIEKEKLISLYKLADIVVHPSLYEATGNITLQAMAMGVPLIAANILSIPEMVGDAAVLFNPYSENDLVDSILRVLKDENLRDKLIEKGHKRIEQFSSWQPLMEQFMDDVVALAS